MFIIYLCVLLGRISSLPDKGIPDMTCISDIDEQGINRNLKVRYQRDEIYVSFFKTQLFLEIFYYLYKLSGNKNIL